MQTHLVSFPYFESGLRFNSSSPVITHQCLKILESGIALSLSFETVIEIAQLLLKGQEFLLEQTIFR